MGKYTDKVKALKEQPCPDRSRVSPQLNPDGVPCSQCPSCSRGEFWRYPKYHKDHDPNGWVCWFCSPPPRNSGPCDYCGVPDKPGHAVQV
jgi:hypothetical protein